jgi:VanZ family protein
MILRRYIFTLIVAAVIMYLSMANSNTFDNMPGFKVPSFDKFVHFGMYFGLMTALVVDNRKIITNLKGLLLISLIPATYGILIEILQKALTTTRSASVYDALADFLGIMTAVVLFYKIKPLKEWIFRS